MGELAWYILTRVVPNAHRRPWFRTFTQSGISRKRLLLRRNRLALVNVSLPPRIEWVRKIVSTGVGRLEFIPPMMPTLVAKPPQGDDWVHEAKFDGYRSQIICDAIADRRVLSALISDARRSASAV